MQPTSPPEQPEVLFRPAYRIDNQGLILWAFMSLFMMLAVIQEESLSIIGVLFALFTIYHSLSAKIDLVLGRIEEILWEDD